MYNSPSLQVLNAFAFRPLLVAVATALSTPSIAADANIGIDLPTVSVTSNPLGVASDELVVPVAVISGRELSLKRESTLGETLNGIPGVSATQFGPNASRPVIRGLDGERVRIMQNGTSILDASSLSFDHAVGVDPLIIEQIDVVRGPAALLYGGSAVGGVVNAIDHRIPKEQLDGATGRAETRFGGPSNTRNGAAVIDVGNGKIAIHADAYTRKTDDLDIPGYAVSRRKSAEDGTPRENRGKLANSSADGDGGALGAALTFENGYIGTSFSTMRNNYGVVAEEDVRIDMKSDRWDVASEFTDLSGIINRVKLRAAHTDYEHRELENGNVGTTFKNRGMESSIELGHRPFGALNGTIGYQFSNTNFEALGEEAFVPDVNTQNHAAYLYEELAIGQHKITFGGRLGHTSVDSKDNANFGAGQRNSFNPNSAGLGGLYSINANWSVTGNFSHNERAPSYFELYANGAHMATGQFEVGNANFQKERSNGIDAQLRWKDAKNSFSIGTYYTRFSNFIGLFGTGNEIAVGGELLPEAKFMTVPAVFKGFESEAKFGLTDSVSLNLLGDYVHAKDLRNDKYLPRIAPLRLGAGLQYQRNKLGAKLDVLKAFAQTHTAESELKTDGYINVSALVSYKLPTKLNLEIFAKANNLLNQEIREHASFLKDISMQGQRSILFGLRGDF
ncbi:TonB-dependent receptor [Methylotenera mobilis]|uniref:TonB-dependent receptor n=1 Tax=Methylotenera mobilis (strain JLW8 / ATCC BAA-1282 / DSM 17540) TaxID=583345 RepID=C6WT38_METML|nr:TonB-dependent receptor [Methylotenera mobilis]ACT49100.1 TonB-dependent receptor [Methylotenera mobilis JLW8]